MHIRYQYFALKQIQKTKEYQEWLQVGPIQSQAQR